MKERLFAFVSFFGCMALACGVEGIADLLIH